MGRRPSYTPLNIFMGQRLVGQLNLQSTGAIHFAYDESWLSWEHRLPISLSLPLREDRYIGRPVIAVFENLLPDNDDIRRQVAQKVGAQGTDAYSLLAEIGRDCVGALQFLPDDKAPSAADKLTGEPLDEEKIEILLKNLKTTPLGVKRDNDFRISVAGAQDKTALLWKDDTWFEPSGTTPTTHIIKPVIGRLQGGLDFSHSVENEHFCLRLLEAFGLPAANTHIKTFGKTKALIVERFDRRWTKDGRLIRLPQEDCCQALSVPPSLKYQSDGGPGIVEITKLLQRSDEPLRDQLIFFKANVLFWLIGATDGHAKNFSIALTPGGRFIMTPLYDVLTVQQAIDAGQLQAQKVKMAMRVGKGNHYRINEIVGRHFVETGVQAGLSKAQIQKAFDEICARGEKAFSTAISAMPKDFPEELFASVKSAFEMRVKLLGTTN